MDFTAPVSKFMSKKLLTVSPLDNMIAVKEIFNNNRIHHIPVVKYKTIVGIVSKADYLYFLRKVHSDELAPLTDNSALENTLVEDIMTTGMATMESTERVNVALDVLSENLFHAIPIVDNGELVGIFTTQDVIKILMEEDLVRMKSNQLPFQFTGEMNIEVFSVKGFSGNLLKNMLEEALLKNKLAYTVSLTNSVDRFIEAGLVSVPAVKIGNKIIQNSTDNAMEEMIREAVDFLKENEEHDILVPVDFSAASLHGLHYAKMMAGSLGLGINIVHVHYPIYDPVTSVSLDEHLMKESELQVEELAAELRKEDEKSNNPIRISSNLEIGGIDMSLNDILQSKKYDLMVMGTKGTDTGIRRLFGTVTSTLSRHGTKPVIVVPPQAEIKFPGKIVIGFTEELIIDKTLESLLTFGAKNNVFFDFVHINDDEKAFKKLKDKLYEHLMSNRDLLVGFNIRSMPLGQKPIDEVLSEYADGVKAGMIVLVAKHRGFIENLTHKSVTKKALLHATLPLMIIHPVLNAAE